MQPLLMKQVRVALEGEGETSRKAREFLLKNFMDILTEEPARAVEKLRTRRAEKRELQADEQYEKNLADEREVARALDLEFEDDYEDESEDLDSPPEDNEDSPDKTAHPLSQSTSAVDQAFMQCFGQPAPV